MSLMIDLITADRIWLPPSITYLKNDPYYLYLYNFQLLYDIWNTNGRNVLDLTLQNPVV